MVVEEDVGDVEVGGIKVCMLNGEIGEGYPE